MNSEMSGPTIQGMVSGATIDLENPDWRDIDLTDIAYGMAAVRRWNGQARRHVCDAEHSGAVAALVPAHLKLAAELHDAQEAPFGDWTRPSVETLVRRLVQRFAWLQHADVRDVIDGVKFGLDVAIARAVLAAFGPASYPDGWSEEREAILLAHEMRSPEVKAADEAAAAAEEPNLGRGARRGTLPPAPPDDIAAIRWLERVKDACAERYREAAVTPTERR